MVQSAKYYHITRQENLEFLGEFDGGGAKITSNSGISNFEIKTHTWTPVHLRWSWHWFSLTDNFWTWLSETRSRGGGGSAGRFFFRCLKETTLFFCFFLRKPTPPAQGPMFPSLRPGLGKSKAQNYGLRPPPGAFEMPRGLGFDFENCALGRGCRQCSRCVEGVSDGRWLTKKWWSIGFIVRFKFVCMYCWNKTFKNYFLVYRPMNFCSSDFYSIS